jgi:hypothetical protein
LDRRISLSDCDLAKAAAAPWHLQAAKAAFHIDKAERKRRAILAMTGEP